LVSPANYSLVAYWSQISVFFFPMSGRV